MTDTRTWKCLCGTFEGEVTGPPDLAVWCHCEQCRQVASCAMQLGVWGSDKLKAVKGDDTLIKYESTSGTFRNACSKCGAFCYKVLGNGAKVAPLGALSGADPIKPTCHIFVRHKGNQDIPFPELPQHDEFP